MVPTVFHDTLTRVFFPQLLALDYSTQCLFCRCVATLQQTNIYTSNCKEVVFSISKSPLPFRFVSTSRPRVRVINRANLSHFVRPVYVNVCLSAVCATKPVNVAQFIAGKHFIVISNKRSQIIFHNRNFFG